MALLRAARQEGISTAMETCGYWPSEQADRWGELVDWFLWDLKAEPALHKSLTGVAGELPLRNLRLLHDRGVRLWVRIVLVPQVNATDGFLRHVAALAQRLANVERFELLAYHTMGQEKYRRFGLERPSLPARPVSQEDLSAWRRKLLGMAPSLAGRLVGCG